MIQRSPRDEEVGRPDTAGRPGTPRLGVRQRAVSALDRAGLLDRLFWLRARLGVRDFPVLAYHRVGRVEDVGELDPGLIEVEPQDFADQLEVLRTRCTVISMTDFRLFSRGKKLPPNPVLITFDDGYADAHDVALPILRKASMPATFFVPTAFPDGGKLFWWDRVWLVMRRCRLDHVTIDYPRRLSLRPACAPEEAAHLLCQAIKRTLAVDLGRLWEELEEKTGVSLDPAEERAIAGRTLMSWSAARRLRDAGMDVQSHSHAHLVLNTLTPEAAERDLRRASSVLREALGTDDVYSIAYPVGYALPLEHRRAPLGAGLELGFTNCTGICSLRRFDPLGVPRIPMGLKIGLLAYKAKLIFGRRSASPRPPSMAP